MDMLLAPWQESYNKPAQHIIKQRHYFATKGPYSQSYIFSGSKEGYDKPGQQIKKQRHRFASKGVYSQSCDFSNSNVWM